MSPAGARALEVLRGLAFAALALVSSAFLSLTCFASSSAVLRLGGPST